MSKLAIRLRPYVVFDPSNEDHRKWVGHFSRTMSWKDCPVRFLVDDSSGTDLISLMQRKLIDYYISTEFGSKNKG